MSNQPLTEQQRAELQALEKLPDDHIDTSDIPEVTDEQWLLARRGNLYRPVKQSVTIRLDADVLAWFKHHAPNRGYQTDINTVLRNHVIAQEKKSG